MKEERLEIKFGSVAPRLKEQLSHFDLPEATVDWWQMDADAITRLRLRGLIDDDAAHRARVKLRDEIERRVTDEFVYN